MGRMIGNALVFVFSVIPVLLVFTAESSIHSGPPDRIAFQDPSSGSGAVIHPGTVYQVKVQVFDSNGSKVDVSTTIKGESLKPEIGKIVDKEIESDETGMATFGVMVTGGDLNDTFPVVAMLVSAPEKRDTIFLVVGKPRDRLLIFYGDTLAYDATEELHGCAGVRLPVTVRAMNADLSEITTERSTAFSIQLSTGLAAYADETSGEKLTTSALVNGVVKLWVQATVKNVSNGELSVLPSDPGVTNGTRGGIYFSSCFKQISTAVAYADNCRGAVDRVVIRYDHPLNQTEIPDSINLYWPSIAIAGRTVYKQSMTIDTTDRTLLSVLFPEPFPEGITRYSGSNNLGISHWSNPTTPNAPSSVVQFTIEDGVGPLLANAMLIERLNADNDTLIISFTEKVDFSVVRGQSLTLLKNGTPHQLNIIAAQPHPDGTRIVVIAERPGENSPAAGDSLMISAEGPIVDASGNRAHPQNRPAVITMQSVAPDIIDAAYLDRDANGIVETVRIQFNKMVNPKGMMMKFAFDMFFASGYPMPSAITPVEGGGGLLVDVRIDDLFRASEIADRTSGTMKVEITFTDFKENNIKGAIVADSAAPVLISVEYHTGRHTDNEPDADTLYVEYSEPLDTQPAVDQPLLFISKDGMSYNVTVEFLDHKRNGFPYLFIVTATQPQEIIPRTVFEQPGDSAWINTMFEDGMNAVDGYGNVQMNPANKRVELRVHWSPIKISEWTVPDSIEDSASEESTEKEKHRGCGFGSGLAFIPPVFYYTRRRVRKRWRRRS